MFGSQFIQNKICIISIKDAELCHVISMCDSRIPFISLQEALKSKDIPHSGILLESDGAAISIKVDLRAINYLLLV